MSRSGIVNVRMVITEEKILSNIDKVQKLINPNSKKQIVQLEEDTYFKDLVESIKTYLNEYPKKKNFPSSVYNAAYGLVEYATNQFEENTKKIEELIRQREQNIALAGQLKELIEAVDNKENQKQRWIQVHTELKGGYLIIKISNPAEKKHVEREKRDGHGYGIKIIQDIVKQYDGIYKTEYKQEIYTALLAIRAV